MFRIIFKMLLLAFVISNVTHTYGQTRDYAREVIDTLCSSYMAGRGYVEEGDLKAAIYITEQFKNHELKMPHNSYLQNFNVTANTFPGNMNIKIDGQKLVPGIDFIIDPCSSSLNGDFDMVVFKKSWLSDDNRLHKELAKHQGKLIVIDETKLNLNQQETNRLTRQLKSLPETIGIILLTHQKLTWSVSQYVCSSSMIIINKSSVKSTKKIKVQVDQAFEESYKTQNVISFIPGTKFPDSLIVYSAHYDHLGMMGNATIFPGANDNASGVAMLLNLAKHYSEEPPPFTVVFIAFGAEELGLLGSRFFVENPLFPLKNIKFLINLDMVGTGDDGLTVVNGTIFKDHFKVLTSMNDSYQLLPLIKQRGESCNSDHCYFYTNGVPSFFFYTMGGIRAYHDVNDKAESLPLTKFEETFKLIVLFSEYLMGNRYN